MKIDKKVITAQELYYIVYKEATRDHPLRYMPKKEWYKFKRRLIYNFKKLNSPIKSQK